MATDLILYFKRVIKTQMCIILFSILGQLEFEFSFFLQSVLSLFIGHVNIFFTPVFYPALIWFMILCKVCQTERQFWAIFTMHLWIGTVFLKKISIWLHAISSKELLDFIFSFWLLFFPLLKPIRWLGSVPPLGLFSSEYFGRQKILLGKCLLQWVTMCYNRS